MKLDELKKPKGSIKIRKRVGRGRSSGLGKTSGRGQKGQNSRSGGGKGPGFEGGQNPLQRRVPKLPGFTNINRKAYQPVNIMRLDVFDENTTVTPETFFEKKFIRKRDGLIKVLGKGEIAKKLTVKAHAFSSSAAKKIEAAGGKAEIVSD